MGGQIEPTFACTNNRNDSRGYYQRGGARVSEPDLMTIMTVPERPLLYRVYRYGGRSGDEWRMVAKSKDQGTALMRYKRIAGKLRQGGVRLTAPTGYILNSTWAPRLRTQW